ncbi:MAG: hypothetical protein Q8R92_09120 [Deltaproteobacteria bacterium]|nr:hypothetical protein [Deltaproteobacteria bacterium]
MKSEVSVDDITKTSDPEFRLRMMRKVIETVKSEGSLHMPLLSLVSTFLDGLAAGGPAGTKAAYLDYLQAHFPDLCAALGAEIFYSKYRSAAVHEFSIKKGFGINRDSKMPGEYCGTTTVRETGQELTILNIDRLVEEFLAHVRALEKKAGVGGTEPAPSLTVFE